MLAGVAILPTAPLLVPGASPTLPEGIARVCDAIDATVELLPAHDVVVLLAGGESGRVHTHTDANLAGIGRPDIVARARVATDLAAQVAERIGYPVVPEAPLPLDLAVLALLVGEERALVPLVVPHGGSFAELVGVGATVVDALTAHRAVAIAAGDLAAGLTERSPLFVVDGAADFDAAVVEAVDAGRLDVLAKLGPEEAQRVGARGWAALVTLHGALEAAKLGLVRRHYAAPQGVGYLVAQGA